MDGHFGRFSATAELAKDLPAVRANEIQIEKVLNNLVRNGLEAMQEAELDGGTVSLTVRPSDREGFAQITIRDNGPGLSENTLQHLFQPFSPPSPRAWESDLLSAVPWWKRREGSCGSSRRNRLGNISYDSAFC